MRRILLVTVAGLAGGGVIAGVTGIADSASTLPPVNRQAAAQRLIRLGVPRYMTPAAQSALRMIASGDRGPASSPPSVGSVPIARGGSRPLSAGLPNVRVNDPALDTHQVDQTTQSEPAITVSGANVAVGYNDSQQTPLGFEAGSSLTGYAYSTNGGSSFTDGGALPNAPEFNNLGDPWLASDRHGNMYFSNLAGDGFAGNLDVGVARSSNGGKTWSGAEPTSRPSGSTLYIADKDAMTVGRDPLIPSRDNVYVAWDDFSIDFNGGGFTGLPVAHSTDGGASWQVSYADKMPLPTANTCSFTQYIGAQPIVNPANGALYVAAEKIETVDPNCTGGSTTFSQWIFRSGDGGGTFGSGVRIAAATPAEPNGLLGLAPGQYMRTAEFPSLAFFRGALYAVWNDGRTGTSRIRIARSTNAGSTWTQAWASPGIGDELMPALSADGALHVLYYRRNANNTLDVFDSDSANGSTFTAQRITNQSSPGVFTIPNFDPVIAPGYMGDYISNVSDGTHRYFVWGDNRDTITNFIWPNGRHDPNVYFAKK